MTTTVRRAIGLINQLATVALRQYCDSEKWRTGGIVANSGESQQQCCNDLVNRCNEIKPGAGDENRTRVLSLGSRMNRGVRRFTWLVTPNSQRRLKPS